MNENGKQKTVTIELRLVVSYSIKYRDYLRTIRGGQIERAQKMVAGGGTAALKKRQNDPKRFFRTDHTTADGEVAGKSVSYIDQNPRQTHECSFIPLP